MCFQSGKKGNLGFSVNFQMELEALLQGFAQTSHIPFVWSSTFCWNSSIFQVWKIFHWLLSSGMTKGHSGNENNLSSTNAWVFCLFILILFFFFCFSQFLEEQKQSDKKLLEHLQKISSFLLCSFIFFTSYVNSCVHIPHSYIFLTTY